MLEKLFEDGEVFEVKGQEFQITSVGEHNVDGVAAGYSYAFRLKSEIDSDHEAAERLDRAEAEKQEALRKAAEEAEVSGSTEEVSDEQ